MSSGIYSSENLSVKFTATRTLTDRGVPNSDVVTDEDPEIVWIEIAGVEVKEEELPDRLIDALLELADNVSFEDE